MLKCRIFFLGIFLLALNIAQGQHLYQLPKTPMEKDNLERIVGNVPSEGLESNLNILWVYGYDLHHISGAHDYVVVKDLMVGLLGKIRKVTIDEAFNFPNQEQFDKADLIVMYLHLPQLSDPQFAMLQSYVENGGGLVSLHETAIMRPAQMGKKLSKCLGSAWNEGTSDWGAIFDDIHIDNDHQIFMGFPDKLTIIDEFYWDLYLEDEVEILGSVRTGPGGSSVAPVANELLSEDESPVFWTYELSKGKVFGTTTGHHTFTYYDPEFRILLFRAMAWVIDENPNVFMPLVFEGITDESGLVGTTDAMRYWEGKRRR